MTTRTRTTTNTPKDTPSTDTPDTAPTRPPGEVGKVGNLTRDPELGYGAESGTAVCRFGLAVSTPVTPGDWSGPRSTVFYEITAFGTLAEHAAQSLTKGARIVVIGRPELDEWTANDGSARTTKRILANAIGPDLRWANVDVHRTGKKTPTETPTAEEELDDSF